MSTLLDEMTWVVGKCSGSTFEIIGTAADGLVCKHRWPVLPP
jgi:hypothetical protein